MAIFNYEPSQHGAVTAIRIYYGENFTPMAELAFAFGGKATIQWTHIEQKRTYEKGINGYTLIFDEREKGDFNSFVR